MMKYRYYIIVLFFGCWSMVLSAQHKKEKFGREEVLEDLAYLYESLRETHFDLFAYTLEAEFGRNYQGVKTAVIKDSLSLIEAIKTMQSVVSAANNAHTRISFPVKSYLDYVQSGGTIFPLEIAIEEGKALVRKNWSNENIKIGTELHSINGMPIREVLEKIYPQISAESRYFKNAQLESLTLPRFYWLAFGEQKTFEIELGANNELTQLSLKAITAMKDFEMKREDILNYERSIDFLTNAMYLNPGNFGGDEKKYRQFIDSAFVEINENNLKPLIIDLRNNPGGDDSFSDYLVSYIADQPFKWSSRFQLKTSKLLKDDVLKNRDSSNAFWHSVFEYEDGKIYDYDFGFYDPQPESKRFKGDVYVLVNRQSYSQSTVSAAQIQDYGFGKIVGEETSEFANLYASIFSYALPNTGIMVDVSKGFIQRVKRDGKDRGVIPDIIIKDHLLDEEDEILEGLINMINKE